MILVFFGLITINQHFEFNYMADSLFIDRQSKLFQKFMQSRAHYSEPETPLTLKTQPPSLDLTSSKENDLDASNKAHQHRTQNDIQSAKHAEEKNTFCLTGASIETSKVVKTDSEKRWVNNSLNIEGGLGLDRILKRAIEKVRSSKV